LFPIGKAICAGRASDAAARACRKFVQPRMLQCEALLSFVRDLIENRYPPRIKSGAGIFGITH